jgi:flagellar biosynthetic protein FlhB
VAGFDENNDDRTEEATQERREDFRERGQVAVSREITAVFVLLAATVVLYYGGSSGIASVEKLMIESFQRAQSFRVDNRNIIPLLGHFILAGLTIALPVCVAAAAIATISTLLQTQFNWSWEKLSPDFSKMNPLSGLMRMVGLDAGAELLKSLAKTGAIAAVAVAVIKSEIRNAPSLMMTPITGTWAHWGVITSRLVWATGGVMLFIAAADFFYNWFRLEKQMKMTKQEVKEEIKRRETDPLLKGRQKRMQREIANRKVVEKTKQATVLITNPTHYSIALKYESGMGAPIVLAKGIDHVALRMREIAKDADIPIVENRPLARAIYAEVDEDQEIPETMYKAVSAIIRYVFELKGINVGKRATKTKTVN